MRLAVISDVHANLQALEAVLEAIARQAVDAIYCLGDVVGYGPDADACVDLIQTHCAGVVRGNHDEAVALRHGLTGLPADGQIAARHNRVQLAPRQRHYLASRPYVLTAHGCTFVHASPLQPEAWHRLDSAMLLRAQFQHFDTAVCFVGHSHVPSVVSDALGVYEVRPGRRYLINVGSVGQPRDGDPRAAFGVFDTDTFRYDLVRVPYDVEATAARIREENLPDTLAERLKRGR
ncbi:metallophosphatase family protein [Rhodothermaceae bacterium RA]|nr:metallophosphatase family protein [Rhodothermaceae bacterium RA]